MTSKKKTPRVGSTRSLGSAHPSDPRPHYIIQLERPGQHLTMAQVRAILAGTGVEVDAGYGPIVVDHERGRHVVRGWANDEARKRAECLPGVRFFGDPKIAPLGSPL